MNPVRVHLTGMDVCGRVEAITPSVVGFSVGDIIVASNGALPVGGMAEYMVRYHVKVSDACDEGPLRYRRACGGSARRGPKARHWQQMSPASPRPSVALIQLP